MQDTALPPELIDGLDDYIPQLQLVEVPDATHWIVHEQTELVAREIGAFLLSKK
jgi:pimeloyl-ACP methyl ester carboxylesterase